MFGPGGPGGVYKLDGVTGKITVFAILPNSGPSLGNIAYDRVNKQFFVSNFEDGLIYRLAGDGHISGSPGGTTLGTYDHGVNGRPTAGVGASVPDDHLNTPNGFTQFARRVWGLQPYDGRLYYSVWGRDPNASVGNRNDIFSIALNPSGTFDLADIVHEIDIPVLSFITTLLSRPVSDIAFSSAGNMLLAERGRVQDYPDPPPTLEGAHEARVLEYTGGTSSWSVVPNQFYIGTAGQHSNSAGGVDYGYAYRRTEEGLEIICDSTVWATGNGLLLNEGPHIPVYGLQGTPAAGNTPLTVQSTGYFIDLNLTLTTEDKTAIGDVELNRASCRNDPCETNTDTLIVNTGFDHPNNTTYAVGGNDAFWRINKDPDPTRTVPRPAEVIMPKPGLGMPVVDPAWAPPQAQSQWIGPSQILPDPNPPGYVQGAVGRGTYTYCLDFCIVDETADSLTFTLDLLVDNEADVWLQLPDGTRHPMLIGSASSSVTPTSIINTLSGSFAPGTYTLEVDVFNDANPPDFTGMNLVGAISGANLFLLEHECCNSLGKLTGTKFEDLDGDGVQDPGENGLEDVTINLLDASGTVVATTTTDSAGDYFFDVAPGTYTVMEVVPTGYEQTSPTSGMYTVTVGPGGIVPNLDFGNRLIPCLWADAVFQCRGDGSRYLKVSLTNHGSVEAHLVTVSSLTPGVSFTLNSATPALPLASGSTTMLDIDFSGLSQGSSAAMVITMHGPVNPDGTSEVCCIDTLQVVRPAIEILCDHVVIGILVSDGGPVLDGWVIRSEDLETRQTFTTLSDSTGRFVQEGLPQGSYRVSVDLQFGWEYVEPDSGYYEITLSEREPVVEGVRFVLSQATRTDIERLSDAIPTAFALDANYPNPFNPTTTIRYALPEVSSVHLVVFDMLGRMVATLIDATQPPGQYQATFEADNLPSGVYLYRLTAGAFVETKRMLLIK